MSVFGKDLLDNFYEIHTEIGKALSGLPPESLDWVPGPEMNSIAVLVVHLAGAEKYWIGVAMNEPPERDREAEFQTHGLRLDEITAYLTASDEYARQALGSLSLSDLETARVSPRNGKTFNAGWCLAHALEHSALHAGHIQMTRQLWEQKGSKIPA